jgi:ATP-dependent helicase HrpB
LLAARALGVAQSGATLCALISERDVVMRSRDRGRRTDEVERSDLMSRLELFEGLEGAGFDRQRASSNEVDVGALRNVARVRDRLLRVGSGAITDENFDRETALLQCILLAFPDRVARRRNATSSDVVFVGGGSAKLDPSSVVKQAELMVVTEVTDQRGSVLVRQASEIEPEWLLELLPERIVERTHTTFNDTTERVEQSLLLAYDDLVLDESKSRDLEPVSAAKTLFEAAAKRGPQLFGDVDEVTQFASRVAFARRKDPSLPALGEQPALLALERACEGAFTFADLKARGLLQPLQSLLSSSQLARVEQLVPERVLLPGGRRVVVHYEANQPPWIESRLQDFFGMRDGPKLGGEPLVIHFLAPNMRALQVTTDLAGFWTRHYPDLRKQLMRRYPKHSWPEDPLTAKPPEPRGRR